MKSIIISIVIASVVITGGIFYTNSLDAISGEMTSRINAVKEHINNEDFENATKSAERLHDFFRKKRFFLAGTVDHSLIVKIEENYAEMQLYTREEQRYDALAKCDALLYYFEYLPSNYSLKAENIL